MIGTDKFFQQLKEQLSKFSESDSLTVSILIDLIKNNLTEDLHDKIPEELKSIYESRDFTSSYDATKKILASIGVPEDLLETLSISDLYKLIQSLSIFINDQSSYEFFYKILNLFDEEIYAAELFLAYDKENDDIYLTPKWINIPPQEIQDTYKTIDYDDAYNSIPELLITKDEWLNQIHNNNITLPIRTNILLVVSHTSYNISYLNNIISTILFNYLKTSSLSLYLQGSIFNIQFADIIKIYYYIIALFNNITYLTYNQPQDVTLTISSNNTSLSSLDDIDTIINKHDNVKDKSTYQELNNYIKSNFQTLKLLQPTEYAFSDLETEIYSKYPNLVKYLNSLYNNSADKLLTLHQLILDIKKSIYQNYPSVKYISIFVNTFLSNTFQFSSAAENFNTIKFMQFYKPIDVLLLDIYLKETILLINDKFNTLYIDDKYKLSYQFSNAVDIYNILDYVVNTINPILNTRFSIFDISQHSIQSTQQEDIRPADKLFFFNNLKDITIYNILDKKYLNTTHTDKYRYVINDILTSSIINYINEKLKIKDPILLFISAVYVSISTIRNMKHVNINYIYKDRYIISDTFNITVS